MFVVTAYELAGQGTGGLSSPPEAKGKVMKQSRFPAGWDEQRVRQVLAHYENQTAEEAVAEDEAAYEAPDQAMIEVPNDLLPAVRELLARRRA